MEGCISPPPRLREALWRSEGWRGGGGGLTCFGDNIFSLRSQSFLVQGSESPAFCRKTDRSGLFVFPVVQTSQMPFKTKSPGPDKSGPGLLLVAETRFELVTFGL